MTRATRVMDILSFLFSIGVVLAAGVWLWQSNFFSISLFQQDNAAWYLIRSTGITGYILLTVSVVWGLALSTRMAKDWSPGALSMLLHSTVSWLGLAFGMIHALLLMVDRYFTYRLSDILVPFTGPYRPLAVGFGTLTLWLLLIITPSFALRKHLLSHRAWKRLHYLSYVAFLFVTIHGLMAGTDASHPGFRALMSLSVLVTIILLGYRISIRQSSSSQGSANRGANRPTRRPAPGESKTAISGR